MSDFEDEYDFDDFGDDLEAEISEDENSLEEISDEDKDEDAEDMDLNIVEDEEEFSKEVLQKPMKVTNESERIGISVSKALQTIYRKMMAEIPRVNANTLSLSFLSEEEKQKLAVTTINKTKDTNLGNGTLYDPAMGPIYPGKVCPTCTRTTEDCPGHYGIIKIPHIIHPLAENYVIYVLKSVCHACGKLLISDTVFQSKELGKYSGMTRLAKIADISETSSTACENIVDGRICGTFQRKYPKGRIDNAIPYKAKDSNIYINLYPNQIFKIFDNISDEDAIKLGFGVMKEEIGYLEGDMTLTMHPRNFILRSILVSPNCVRPRIEESVSGNGNWTDAVDTLLKSIISGSESYIKTMDEDVKLKAIETVWKSYKNIIIGENNTSEGRQTMSIKARMKGKNGKNGQFHSVIGKRGDNAARSVITGCNWVGFGRVGVPRFAAYRITIPERVFSLNQSKLQKELRAGKVKYIIKKNGKYAGFRINVNSEIKDNYKLQIGDICRRNLRNGDLVWFGRQPSLSSGSLMGMRVVITEDNTFKFSLPHTKSFNADYDGDEMTIYVPQTPEQYAEAMELASAQELIVTKHSIVPIQAPAFNALSSIYIMTRADTMIPLEIFNDCMMQILNDDKSSVLARSKDLYSLMVKRNDEEEYVPISTEEGKQLVKEGNRRYYPGRLLFSALLPKDFFFTRENVRVVRGILRGGPITSKHVGTARGSMVQVLVNDYGNDIAAQFINDATNVSDTFLETRALSVGIDDITPETVESMTLRKLRELAKKEGISIEDKSKTMLEKELLKRKVKIPVVKSLQEHMDELSDELMTEFENLGPERDDPVAERERKMDIIQLFVNYTNRTSKLASDYMVPQSSLMVMMNSGAKGSLMNAQRIMATTGFQSYRGGLAECNVSKGRTNIYTPKDSLNPVSLGLCKRSFTEGFDPIEWNFHAISGREGLSDTSTQTAEAGEVFKSLMNSLENLSVSQFRDIRNNANDMISYAFPFTPQKMEFVSVEGENFLSAIDVKRMVQKLNVEKGYDIDGTKLKEVDWNYRVLKVPGVDVLKLKEDTNFNAVFKDREGNKTIINADYYEPVGEIKARLSKKLGRPIDALRFMYKGNVLEDNDYVAKYSDEIKSSEEMIQLSINKGDVLLQKGTQSEITPEGNVRVTIRITPEDQRL